ncbi:MAG TPA: hypothetical protein DEQ77_09305 [Candidatus Omnitrophica bacterium]|nr:hypothetical protein [Candidatus Omnitrophota bacterium]
MAKRHNKREPGAITIFLLPLALLIMNMIGCMGNQGKALLLKDWEYVCVPIAPTSLLSLDEALKEKGYGNVMSSDLKIAFTYQDAPFEGETASGIVVYSSEHAVPSNTVYMKMRVWSFYELALDDEKAAGIYVNPNVSGKNPYTVAKAKLREALPKLPHQPALPKDIYAKG